MRRPQFDMAIFKERRDRVAKKMKEGSAMVLPAAPDAIRNRDVRHTYRQESNFYYFTGFEEPDSIFLFRPGFDPEYVLFVRPRDKNMEMWNGFRYGPEGAEREFHADKSYPIGEFDQISADLLKDVDTVYYRINNHEFDPKFFSVLERVKARAGRGGRGYPSMIDPVNLYGEMRLLKTPFEVEMMKRAAAITVEGHKAAMRFVRPGVNERDVLGVLTQSFLTGTSDRQAYPAIVAAGDHATTLHYEFNDQPCNDGDLLLIDAGAEYGYYASDITRTFPINGKFTKAQAKLYQGILDVQKRIIEFVRPGRAFEEIQEEAVKGLTNVMLELGILNGFVDKVIEQGGYKKYYPHNVSHWLGMDVHDVGLYKLPQGVRRLEPGMVLTIEPGIYIPKDDDSAPKEFRGMGIRIEDDLLITSEGSEVLTEGAPKEIAEIEELMKR